ncbi:MAG: rhodanese-like domain-containing protein [Patescibacteria group bacterium]
MQLKRIQLIFLFLVGTMIFLVLVINKHSERMNTDTKSAQYTTQTIERVPVETFQQMIDADSDAVLLDIRTPQEFQSSKIAGSINIDFYQSDFTSQLTKLDKDATYLMYCNSGNRSSTALQQMKDLGFNHVYELQGGITAWNAKQLPTCNNC